MKIIYPPFYAITLIAVTSCQKNKTTTHVPESPHARQVESNASLSDGYLVRTAAKDHSLAPNLRHSAIIFEHVLDGEKVSSNEIRQAGRELATTRSEITCQIFVSIMRASEAGLPEALPPLEELERFEQEASKGAVKGFESNPLRFLSVLLRCVTYLTEFEMPVADQEVTRFLNTFHSKYGKSDSGKYLLNFYQSEINNAMGKRKTGGALWKQGRKDPTVSE